MNLPNKLTVFRIFMIPVFMLLLIFNWPAGHVDVAGFTIYWNQVLAAIVFAIASFTDFLDGHIARARNLVTNFGKFADPLADKMLTMTAFIFLVNLKSNGQSLAPAWVVAIIVCRELAVTGLRLIVVENDGEVIAAKMPGKIKTTTQMLSIIFLLIGNIFYIGSILLYICLVFTIYSGWDYFHQSWDVFKGSM
ncbi:CDP-diacylglycerol--glycerol-3-phosphate 3-phosphatidyltransferase [Lactobacillus sp. PV037]|uniref:CDP-diacylglycerol--glycerol-3-phosphate 3-phosphatidyltransferase n=1 Tax=unclassified Lactobacillus TaxID=2620435 RepID=UPI00223F3973|nr:MULTISPECIES: CDP-diacylglycerol--glycerol-3-phosphate 3-phosphatidyltransferase [unclassified Lactobacillus]QNQ82574.1 CDP-diacylglycerol--glycerol-3-phosphate 3-phosphatidyltransferase [Lactobacillus sp. PV012]QNQ83311.1 CDP-diacylglycerol--glycerol-3-phosphate 3-phosphatidyltransferase [Lactobacillus sp. PV037]